MLGARGNFIILAGLLSILFLMLGSYASYSNHKYMIMLNNHRPIKDIIHTNIGQAIEERIGENNVKASMYDRVTLEIEAKSYFTWLVSGSIGVTVSDIEDNTQILKLGNTIVTEEILNGEIVYAVGEYKLVKYEDVPIIEGVPTSIKIAIEKDSIDDSGVIVEYTVAYQKKN